MIQTEREQYIQQMKEQRRQHNMHEPLKHPGSRDQLRKVWEDIDKVLINTANYLDREFLSSLCRYLQINYPF